MHTTWSQISHWHCSLSVSACFSGSGTRTHPECLNEKYVSCCMLTHCRRVFLKRRASELSTSRKGSHQERKLLCQTAFVALNCPDLNG